MKLITGRRRVAAGVVSVGLFCAAIAAASPAGAFPAKSWWYGELSVAKAQKVSTGAGVTVAVLDTGVQANLPDLSGRVLAGKSFTDSGNPRIDLPDPKARYFGHGTAIAGYLAGNGKGAGMVGIAPAAKILPVRVASDAENSDTDAIEKAIPWAVDQGAKVINISSAGQSACPAAMQTSVDYAVKKNVIIVAGTGNTPSSQVGSPANCIGVIAAGGLADSKSFRAWSGESAGPQLDFVAPAEHMRDLLLTNQLSDPVAYGTSIATALISGTFALLRAKYPTESARQIVTRALYNVHNGFANNVFAKRIDDKLGYGEILPSYALTEAPPKNAVNPIYDEVDKHLKAQSTSSSSSSSAPEQGSSSSSAKASGGSGGSSTAVIVIVAVVVVVLVIAVLGVVMGRRSRRRTPPPGSFGPPGYGPPPR